MEVMSISSMQERQKKLYLYSGITFTIMLFEFIFRPQLISLTFSFITYIQRSYPEESVKYFFKFCSLFGTPSVIIPVFLVLFAVEAKKFLLMKLTFYICIVGYVVSILKSIYANPGPYWLFPYISSFPHYVPPGVIPLEHYSEYGNPSGHAFLATSFYGYLYYIFLYKKAKRTPGIGAEERSMSISEGSPLKEHVIEFSAKEINREIREEQNEPFLLEETEGHKAKPHLARQHTREEVLENPFHNVLKFLYFTLTFLVCLCRLYLGMHSLNQVMLGLTLGAYLLFIIIHYIDPYVDSFLRRVKNRTFHNRHTLLVKFAGAYLVLTIIPILLYYKNVADSDDEWNVWWPVVQQEVGASKARFGYIKCFTDSAVCGIAFGVIFALVGSESNYFDKGFRFGAFTYLGTAFRVIVFVGTVGIVAGAIHFLPTGEEDWVMNYLINSNLAVFVGSYAAIRLAPWAYLKFDLEADHYFHDPRDKNLEYKFSL